MKNSQSGRMGIALIIIGLIIAVGGLTYVLWMGRQSRPIPPHGVTSPTIPSSDTRRAGAKFSDGLGKPDATTRYELDEFGAGIARRDVFMRDINGDGHADRITRTRIENGTDHYYDDYKIELYDGTNYRDVTPKDMRTIESADCALQRFQFVFRPTFHIIKISRPWRDTWTTPTMATRTTYRINGNEIRSGETMPVKEICNVADLF